MARKRAVKVDKKARAKAQSCPENLRWVSVTDPRFTVRGLAWLKENGGRFCRLPLRAEGTVREIVWNLAQSPASVRLAFRSDATAMAVRVAREAPEHSSPEQAPSSGRSRPALYCGLPGRMRPWATFVPDLTAPSSEHELFVGIPRKVREFRFYLPHEPGLVLELGVSKGARLLAPSPPVLPKPVVIYGTSITQGSCAWTAGTDYVSALGRMLNLDVVNLGFSGSGRGEAEVAELISEIDAALYVLDYLANVDPVELKPTLPRFIDILRARRPDTPILLVTNVCFSQYDFYPPTRVVLEARRDIMMENYIRHRKRGDRNIHLVDGFALIPFGTDSALVDGVHPTDHGFRLMADRMAPVIEQILLLGT
ncbi:MAG: SGNH/GDSL hydrolase family protein [Candidatus Brocadiia bacterium]|jgi:lysophospholipase L1-like esterase|nr:SGNH/GDSL hydrolase family protein [Candidatus Brocadiia bacterium]